MTGVVTGISSKSAVTVLSLFMVTVQTPEPEHAPYHPTNRAPSCGTAISETFVPNGNFALHWEFPSPCVAPQVRLAWTSDNTLSPREFPVQTRVSVTSGSDTVFLTTGVVAGTLVAGGGVGTVAGGV